MAEAVDGAVELVGPARQRSRVDRARGGAGDHRKRVRGTRQTTAQAALERAGLWAALTPKLVFAENVRQSLNYVGRAEVDAGFVYRTDALLEKDKVRIDLAVPGTGAVLYPIARVAASRNAQPADDFIAFIKGAPGQAVLARHGFARP